MRHTFSNVRNANTPGEMVARILKQRGMSHAALSRATGIRYTDILREVKNRTRPLSFYNAAIIADVLDVDLTVLTHGNEVAA